MPRRRVVAESELLGAPDPDVPGVPRSYARAAEVSSCRSACFYSFRVARNALKSTTEPRTRLLNRSSSAASVSHFIPPLVLCSYQENGGVAAPGTMSGRGDEAGESSGTQEPAAATEPLKRRPGRPRKPPKVSKSLRVAAVRRGRSAKSPGERIVWLKYRCFKGFSRDFGRRVLVKLELEVSDCSVFTNTGSESRHSDPT